MTRTVAILTSLAWRDAGDWLGDDVDGARWRRWHGGGGGFGGGHSMGGFGGAIAWRSRHRPCPRRRRSSWASRPPWASLQTLRAVFRDNRGSYYAASTGATAAPAATTLELIDPPAGGTFGSIVTVTAELTSGGIGLANQQVLIQIGGAAAFGVTGADGRATVTIALNTAPPATMPVASFGATEAFAGSSDAEDFVLGRAPTSLSAVTPFNTTTDDLAGVLTTLTATLGTTDQPLMSRTVTVTVDGPVTRTLSLITDYLGRVRLPLDLPAGTYAVVVDFAGDETYEPTDASGATAVIPFSFRAPVDNEPTVNTVKSGSTVPIKFSLGGDHGLNVLAGTPVAVKYDCESAACGHRRGERPTPEQRPHLHAGGLYQYNWKSPKASRGCYRFELALDDGTTHIALFKLR